MPTESAVARPTAEVARFERAVLLYTPLWVGVIAWCMTSGVLGRWRDGQHLALGLGLAAPLVALPFILGSAYARRAIAYLALTTFLQMWLGSILFFDRLGMEYRFQVTWTWNRSPVFLYPLTLAYFATYYVVVQVLLRRCDARTRGARLALLAVLSYAVAFAETAAMASPVLRAFFAYRDKRFMLLFGSFCYGTVFFATMPGFLRAQAPRPLGLVVRDALIGNALVFAAYGVYWFVLPLLGRP